MSCLIRRHLSAFILAQLFLLTSTFAQAVWQPFTDREAGFTVSFPGKPSYEEGSLPQTGGSEETYKFHYGENFLWVKFAPLPRVPRNPVELGRVYAEIARDFSTAGALVREEKLPDGGRQYYNVADVPAGRVHMLTRVYIHGGRQYHIIYGTFAPAGVDERLADHFFSSFKFIETQPSRPSPTRKGLSNGDSRRGAKRPGWYVLRGSDGDFVARFPGKPEYSLTSQSDVGADVHKFRFFFGETLFVLSYWEITGEATNPEQRLRAVVSNHIAGERARGRVLKQVSLRGGGYEVESQGVFNNVLLNARVRFYVRGTRIYTLTTMTQDPQGPNRGDLDKFFASFRLNMS